MTYSENHEKYCQLFSYCSKLRWFICLCCTRMTESGMMPNLTFDTILYTKVQIHLTFWDHFMTTFPDIFIILVYYRMVQFCHNTLTEKYIFENDTKPTLLSSSHREPTFDKCRWELLEIVALQFVSVYIGLGSQWGAECSLSGEWGRYRVGLLGRSIYSAYVFENLIPVEKWTQSRTPKLVLN